MVAVSTTKTGFDNVGDAVSSANMMAYANSVDNLINNILNGVQAFDLQKFSAAATMQVDGSNAIGVPTQELINVSAWTGTFSILKTIGVSNNRRVILKATSGHSIFINGDGSGNITSIDGGGITITGDRVAELVCLGSQWALIGSTGGVVGQNVLNTVTTVDPAPSNDVGSGYTVGSLWTNTTADRSWMSVDSSSAAAIWKQITPPKNKWAVRAANASALGVGIANPTVANSPANANDAVNTFITLPTTAAAGNIAGWITGSFNLIRPSHDPIFEVLVKTGAAADLANQRIWIGLVDADITNVDTLAAGREFIGFRYSSAAADPGWMPVLHDGTTQNVGTVLGGVIAASTVYKLRVRVDSANSKAYFSVNDGAEQMLTTNFPPIATDLGAIVRNIPVTAVIRTMSFSSFDVRW